MEVRDENTWFTEYLRTIRNNGNDWDNDLDTVVICFHFSIFEPLETTFFQENT